MPPVPDAFLRLASVSYIEFGTRGGPEREILRDVSLAASQGESIALLSPDLEARSTLLRMIAGFLTPTSGFISLRQKRTDKPGPDRAFVLRETTLFPWLTVQQNIEEVLRVTAGPLPPSQLQAAALEYLHSVGLAHAAATYSAKLSRADLCWATLARSMAARPDVLLLEDPFTTLTLPERAVVLQKLSETRQRQALTLLFSTDDSDLAQKLADRIALVSPVPAARIRQIVTVNGTEPQEVHKALKTALETAVSRSTSVRTTAVSDV